MALTQIDEGLSRYYASLGRNDYFNDEGIGKFTEFCELHGFEDDGVEDELEEMEGCLYLGFDNDFPYNDEYQQKDDHEKQAFMFEIFKKLHENPQISFGRTPSPGGDGGDGDGGGSDEDSFDPNFPEWMLNKTALAYGYNITKEE
eukprot:157301_1